MNLQTLVNTLIMSIKFNLCHYIKLEHKSVYDWCAAAEPLENMLWN